MKPDSISRREGKPLAGNCAHVWEDRKTPRHISQICSICKLYRYKTSRTADWEYRAPIPFARGVPE